MHGYSPQFEGKLSIYVLIYYISIAHQSQSMHNDHVNEKRIIINILCLSPDFLYQIRSEIFTITI